MFLNLNSCNSTYRLRYWNLATHSVNGRMVGSVLQQYLPFTVLKQPSYLENDSRLRCNSTYRLRYWNCREGLCPYDVIFWLVATVLTVYGIETWINKNFQVLKYKGCNSTYRLRYWNSEYLGILLELRKGCNSTYRLRYVTQGARQQRSKATMRSAHLKYLNEVKVKRSWLGNSTYRLRY